ncbi:unnamed protein product [Hydatigera taeniaeformis]|uniref:Arf-GAP with coiled-coil, ANK repeat and PH domain-containing protein 2 n=1 Tax=Hydatigena taeniaeformis TaxID=6205 RepID=A0A158REI5_HYDTA|nr:unnamed protein product [Hydatigera taeniaeformis]
MSAYITIGVNGKELWNSLNFTESLRFSPIFQLALRTSEAEVDLLQDRYKEAAEMFTRTSKAGEAFADALNGLSRCLNNLVTPSPNLPISIDREAEIQRIIRSIYTFSNLVSDFSSRLAQPSNVLFQAGVKLDELHQARKEFQRASEQVDVAVNKSAGVSRSRTSDAEEVDTTLLDARGAYARVSESYLSLLRNVLCPIRLSTVLRATLCTFEIQQNYSAGVAALTQPDDCVSSLRKSVSIYDAEVSNTPKFISNGVSTMPSLDQSVRFEGYLFKRSKKKRWKTWIRRWFRVKDNQLIYFSSLSDTYTSITWKVLEPDLRLCTAKPIASNCGSVEPSLISSSAANITERRFVFELISPTGKIHFLQAESSDAMEKWVTVLRTGLLNSAANGEARASNLLTTSSLTGSRESLRSLSGALLLDEPATAGNRSCADCLTSNDVKWASTNLGVTLCTDCAACHRSLGVHISKVRSLTLDNWEPELLEVMRNLGNNLVSSVYESNLPPSSASETCSLPRRPQEGELNAQLRRAWVEAKWVRRLFVRSFVQPSVTMWLLDLYRSWLLQAHSRRTSRPRHSPPGSKASAITTPSTLSATVFGPVAFGPRITRSHHPRLVDRRRFSTVVRGCTARAQVTLALRPEIAPCFLLITIAIADTLCAHLDSIVFGEPRSLPLSPSESMREKAAARLVLVAGARLGCAPLILAGLARGASPNALPLAAEWARIYRLPQPADGDPLGVLTPPLISAVTGGRIAACELLLTNGADINALDQDGRTALHHACSLQRVHLVCLLLRRQANQEIRDKDGRRPIDVAIDTAHADIVTLLRLQPLHSDSKIMDSTFSVGGKDDTAIEVFRDFTTRAYHLEWDSYYRISRNYRWSLGQMFDEYKYNLTIIVEDDIDVAPDFFDYFSALAPLLMEDKSLFCISAWNDNGIPTLIDKSRNDLLYRYANMFSLHDIPSLSNRFQSQIPLSTFTMSSYFSELIRSDFFPGLGWMLTRQLWDEELREAWPLAYWDEFMRKKAVRRGRSCIRPEISRSHTFGRKGVSNGQFFDSYLRFNYLNDKPFVFNTSLLRITLKPTVYDARFLTEVYDNTLLLNDSSQLSHLAQASSQDTACRLEYKTQAGFVAAARLLGAMEDFKEGVARTAYMGIVSVFFRGRRIYLAPGGSRGWGNDEYPNWI